MKLMTPIKSLLLVLLLALSATNGNAAPVGTGFLYQGLLTVDGRPASGSYDMIFTLFRLGEAAPGTALTIPEVSVMLGVFTVKLDYGQGVFDGAAAYELGIAVRESDGDGDFTTLGPRQRLTPTPFALSAQTASSVPDSALSSNVPLLNGSPMFSSGITVTMLRVADAGGGGVLRFGPTDDCSIGVDPQGPAGLLLRDPRGVRILSPDPAFPSRLLFGPTDDCSIGIDPAFPGLVERDPIGFRLLGQNSRGCRLIFGQTMDCTVEVDPAGPQGLLLRDPRGIRILPPGGGPGGSALPRLIFGPTDDCSIGIDPQMTGLLLRDPRGVRIAPTDPMAPPRLIFGPTDDCSIGIDPVITGLLLRDPRGVRIAPTGPMAPPPRLLFGPTDDCSIGIDPAFPGLVERDPIGFRLLGQNSRGCRLIFGQTMDCTVEVDPIGPAGLLLRDPRGIRILPRDAAELPRLLFGPTDDCSIGIDPAFPGLVERDPIGFRLLGRNNQGCRLIFGPTMNCTVEVDPAGPQGLLLRDPSGIRILPPGNALPRMLFGPTDDCSIGIDPAFSGLVERDPVGLRLLGQNNQGGRLIFGPTMNCTIEVQPPGTSNSVAGLILRDPRGVRILSPVGPTGGTNTLLFGPTDDCRITAGDNSAQAGMRFSDPRGFSFGSQVTVNGPVFAQAFIQTSSRRFKNDVKPIEKPLEKIGKLQGVHFTWNEEKGGRQDIGFIAEEVAKVIPEVVAWEEDGENARGVNYDHLVAVAVEGIKAQQTQIQTLERERAELKQSLETMQAQLDRLSRQIQALVVR